MSRQSCILESTCAAPSVDQWIQDELLDMYPKHFLHWSKKKNRWEIWIALSHNSDHVETDRWVTEHQCFVRKLQTYKNEDGSFAPIDERLLVGLAMADTWANRRFFEEHVDEAEAAQQAVKDKDTRSMFGAASRYYHGRPNPIVGRTGKNQHPGWRRGSI